MTSAINTKKRRMMIRRKLFVLCLCSFLPLFLYSNSVAAINEGGTISQDTYWSNSDVHHVTSSVTVVDQVKLTIEPGTIVKFAPGRNLTVKGTLLADASGADQIVFTSIKDDKYGGDSNGDGGATTATAGSWDRLNFVNGSPDSILANVLVSYGGSGGSGNIYMNNTDVTIKNSVITAGSSYGIYTHISTPLISWNTITNNSSHGIYTYNENPVIENNTITGNTLDGINHYAYYHAASLPVDRNNTIEGNGRHGIYVSHYTPDTVGYVRPTIDGNTIRNNTNYGIYFTDGQNAPEITNNIITGNQKVFRLPFSSLPGPSANNTLSPNTIDNHLEYWGNQLDHDLVFETGNTYYQAGGNATVATGVKLTIEPGTIVKFAPGRNLTVKGTLLADASGADQIVFTSIKDDKYGGDSNGDGGATTATAGSWDRLNFVNGSPDSILANVLVSYGGSGGSGNIYMNNTDVTIKNSVITAGSSYGIYTHISTPLISWNTITNNSSHGIYTYNENPVIENNTITGNTLDGINHYAYYHAASLPVDRNNTIEGNGRHGIYVSHYTPDTVGYVRPTIDGNTIRNNTNYGIYFTDGQNAPEITNNIITGNLIAFRIPASALPDSTNTLTPNVNNFLEVHGNNLQTDKNLQVWGKGTGNEIGVYIIFGTLRVPTHTSLKIDPGVIVKFQGGALVVDVDGALIADATFNEKIIFTTIKDDYHGGDTNKDVMATYPVNGSWKGITLNASLFGEGSIFNNTKILYAGGNGSGALYFNGVVSARIENTEISKSSSNGIRSINGTLNIIGSRIWGNNGDGIRLEGASNADISFSHISTNLSDGVELLGTANAEISNNQIFMNRGLAVKNQTANVADATRNWWGDFDGSGPYNLTSNPDGTGGKISDNVSFDDYLDTVATEMSYVNYSFAAGSSAGSITEPILDAGVRDDLWDPISLRPDRTIAWGSNAVEVGYTDLDPEKRYKIRTSYFNGDGEEGSLQSINAGPGKVVHSAMVMPTMMPVQHEFSIPSDYYTTGNINLSFVNDNPLLSTRAALTEIWLLEDFEPELPEITGILFDGDPVNNNMIIYGSGPITFNVHDPYNVKLVEVSINDSVVLADTSGASAYTYQFDMAGLLNGIYTLTIKAFDSFDNKSSVTYSLELAVILPEAPVITHPVSGDIFTAGAITVSGTAEPEMNIVILLNGQPYGNPTPNKADGSFAIPVTLTERENTITAIARNNAGDSPHSNEVTATLNTLLDNPTGLTLVSEVDHLTLSWAPVSPVDILDHYNIYRSETPFTSVVDMTPVQTVTVATVDLNGLAIDTNYYVAVTSVNYADGEKKTVVPVVGHLKDVNGPLVTDLLAGIDNLTEGYEFTIPPTISVSATDFSGVDRVEFLVDGGLVCTDDSGPDFNCFLNIVALSDGQHLLTIKAYDTVGNLSTTDLNFSVVLALPDAPVISLPVTGAVFSSPDITVNGTAEKFTDVELFNNGVSTGVTAKVDDNGQFSFNYSLNIGDNLLSAKAFNRTGFGPASGEVAISFRLANPTGVTTIVNVDNIGISWSPVEPAVHLQQYNVYVSETPFTSVAGMTPVQSVTGTSSAMTGLSQDTKYYLAVTSVDSAGGERQQVTSVLSNLKDVNGPVISALTYNTADIATTPTLIRQGSFRVAAADFSGVSHVEFYLDNSLQATDSSGPEYSWAWNIIEVGDGSYTLTVKVYDSLGNPTSVDYPISVALAPPVAPASINLTSGDGYIDVSWSNNLSPDIKEYQVYHGTESGQYSPPLTTTSGTIRLNNLAGCQTYFVAVKAIGYTGLGSSFSIEKSAVSNLVGSPVAPEGLTATLDHDKVILKWQPNTECDIDIYRIYRSITKGSGYQYLGQTGATTFSDTAAHATDTIYYYVAKAVDKLSNDSPYSQELSVLTGDLTPPAQPTVDPALFLYTSESQFVLRGTKEADSSLIVDGTETILLDNATSWEIQVDLNNGRNTLDLTSGDSHGNICQPKPVTIIKDNQGPTVSSTIPAINSRTNQTGKISVFLSDPNYGSGPDLTRSHENATVEDSSGSIVTGTWGVNSENDALEFIHQTELAEGIVTVTLNPVDKVGNTSTVSFGFTVDKTAPQVESLTMSPPSPHKVETVTFTIKFNESMNTSLQPSVVLHRTGGSQSLSINGSWRNHNTWRGTVAFTETTGDGDYVVEVSNAGDVAGNQMTPQDTGTFVLDAAAPAPPTVDSVDSPTTVSSQVLSGSKQLQTGIVINGVKKVDVSDQTDWSTSYPLKEGENILKVTTRDLAGNDSFPETTVTVELDTTPPVFTIDEYQDQAASATQTLAGTKEPGCSVTLNGETIINADDLGVSWNHEITLVEGLATHLVFRASDALGNTATKTLDLIYDAAPPAALGPGVLMANGSGRGDQVRLGWNNYEEPVDLAYYRIYYSTSEITDVSGLQAIATTNSGTKSFVIEGLTEGTTYYFVVIPVDLAGNSSATVNFATAFPVDTMPPTEVSGFVATPTYSTANGNGINLQWTASIDAGSNGDLVDQLLYVDNGPGYPDTGISLGSEAISHTLNNLADATLYRFKLTGKDAENPESGGVVTEAVTRLDNPAALAAEPGKNQATISWAASGSPYLKNYRVYRLQSADLQTDVGAMQLAVDTNKTTYTDPGLTNGTTYQYGVTVVNTFGLENPVVSTISVEPRQDATGPQIAGPFIVSSQGDIPLTQNQVLARTVTLKANGTDNESAMARVELYIDSSLVQSTTGSSVSYLWNLVAASDGNHSVKVVAYDEHGNFTETSKTVTVSLAPPNVPVYGSHTVEAITPDYLVTIRGTADLYTTVTLKVNDQITGETNTAADGSWTFTSVPLAEGDNNIYLQATHRGGASAFSMPHIITVDTGAPPAPVDLVSKVLPGGTIQFNWQSGPGELPTGYNLYSDQASLPTSVTVGMQPLNNTPIPYLFKEIIPADDTASYYAVTALDGAGNESGLSTQINVASDGIAPAATGIMFAFNGGTPASTVVAGPGTINVSMTVSEPLQEMPFLSLEPQIGSPIVLSPVKVDELNYSAVLEIDPAGPHGPTVWKFSGKDLVGNRGNSQGQGPTLDVRGPVATITTPTVLQQIGTESLTVDFSFDEAPVDIPVMTLFDATGNSAAFNGPVMAGDDLHWTAQIDISPLAEGEATFKLVNAIDNFGNTGETVATGEKLYLYTDTPPAPAAPTDLTATSKLGGKIDLSWSRSVDRVQAYKVYRRLAGVAVEIGTTTGLTFSELPSADGAWNYSVSAVGLLGTEGDRCAEVEGVSDRTGPAVPSGLSLSLDGDGVTAVWDVPQDEIPASYRLYRAASSFASVGSRKPVVVVSTTEAIDTSPSTSQIFYGVTSVDALGNESALSTSVELAIPVAPVNSLNLTRHEDAGPVLAWQSDAGSIQGYYVYRNGNRVNSAPTPSTTYSDGFYDGNGATYGVSVVDDQGNESPIRDVRLPALDIDIPADTVLRRGVIEKISLALTGGEDLTISKLNFKVGSNVETIKPGPISLVAGEAKIIEKVAATALDALDSVAVVTTVTLASAPGTSVVLTRTSAVPVAAAGSAFEVFNEPLVRGAEAQVRIKVNNLGSAQLELLTSERGGLTDEVSVYLRDQDGNLLAKGFLDQRTGSAVVNSNGYASARLEPGGSFLSEPITFQVPVNAPAKVLIEARVAKTYYHYDWPDQVTAPGFSRTVQSEIADLPYFAAATTDKEVYHMGKPVTISGTALSSIDGLPVANVPVRIGVSTRGFDRFFNVDTDAEGNFSHTFTPAANEAGTYSVWATHPELNDRDVQATFNIIGLLVSPSVFNLNLAQGRSYNVPVNIRNLGNVAITGLTMVSEASQGLTATIINSGDTIIGGGENQRVYLKIIAADDAPQTGYASLTVDTDAGLGGKVNVNVGMVTLTPQIRTYPSYIDTGMMRGTQKMVNFTISNSGQEVLRNARIDGPSIPWLDLTIDKLLGDINAGSSKDIGIMLRPGETVAPGIYDDSLVIYSDNHVPFRFNVQVTVSSDAVGSVYFDVQNEIYEKLSGASITLQHQQLLDLRYTLRTASDGTVMLNDIAEGRYSYNVSSPGCVPFSGSFVVEPGLTSTVHLALEVNMVEIEWSVTPTVIEDKYEVTITQTFETNVPTPVLIAEPAGITLPEMGVNEVFNGEFTVKNHGLIAVYDVGIDFPSSYGDFDIEVMKEFIPDRIEPMETIRVQYRVTKRDRTILSSFKSLFEQVTGFGGGNCFSYVTIKLSSSVIICPNTAFERIISRLVDFRMAIPTLCPPSVPAGSAVAPSGGSGGGGYAGGWQGGGGGAPGQTTPIAVTDPCECMDCRDDDACTINERCEDGDCVWDPHPPEAEIESLVRLSGEDAEWFEEEITIVVGETLDFSARNIFAFEGECDLETLEWRLGNGESRYTSGFSYKYPEPGEYRVSVNVECVSCDESKVAIPLKSNGQSTIRVVVLEDDLCWDFVDGQLIPKPDGTKIDEFFCRECVGGELKPIPDELADKTSFKIVEPPILNPAKKYIKFLNAELSLDGAIQVDYDKTLSCCENKELLLPVIEGGISGKIVGKIKAPFYQFPLKFVSAFAYVEGKGEVEIKAHIQANLCDLPDWYDGTGGFDFTASGGAEGKIAGGILKIGGSINSGLKMVGPVEDGIYKGVPRFKGVYFKGEAVLADGLKKYSYKGFYVVPKEKWDSVDWDLRKYFN
ncbi:MAG: right-handed parallel beta-helix repeat-containing protein [Thermodesulfobacteriota bacterium]